MYGKKLPAGVRILLGFLSVLLCVLLFVSTVVTIVVADLKVVTSKNGLQTILIKALTSSSAPARLPAAGLAVGRPVVHLDETNVTNEAQQALIEAIYGMVSEQFGEDVEITKDQVSNLMNSSTVPEFVAEKVAGVISDLVSGESTTTLTKEEVVSLLEENTAVIEQEIGVVISAEDIDTIGNWVEENKIIETVQQEVSIITGMAPPSSPDGSQSGSSGEGDTGNPDDSHKGDGILIGTMPDGKEVISNIVSGKDMTSLTIAEILAVVRTVTSVEVLLICIGGCLLLIGLLFLSHWGRPFAAVRSAGIPVMIAGMVIAIPSVLAMAVPSLFKGTVLIVVRQVLTLTGYVSLGVAAFGLALIVAGAVLNSVMKKRAAAKLAAAAEVVVETPAQPAVEELAAEVLSAEE